MSSIQSTDSTVYYKEQYWDAFPQARRYIQMQVSGHPNRDSIIDFKLHFAKTPFKKGLFLNCGNGWLERLFISHNIVKRAVAFDCSRELIEQAKKKRRSLPIEYFVADANTIELPENEYDLVVNSAALHHVQYLNRLCFQIARCIKPEGVFFHYDYIGPHRNQYSYLDWERIKKVNRSLPKSMQKKLQYAHLPTMLVQDPSEAIHSELILETIYRYFHIIKRRDLSGMIAYNILSLNQKLVRGKKSVHIQKILNEDRIAYESGLIPPLFTYMVTKVNKHVLKETKKIAWWQYKENVRERNAKLIEYTYSIAEFLTVCVKRPSILRALRLCMYLFSTIYTVITLPFAYVYVHVQRNSKDFS